MKFNRIIIRPYSSECGGARDIVKILTAEGIDAKRVYSRESSYLPEPGDFIVNWGASYPPDWAHAISKKNVFLNHWTSVGNSISKTRSFMNFKEHGVPTPDWTTNTNEAKKWSEAGHWVCCRTVENSYDGKGLVLAKKPSQMEWAPLYTKFIPDSIMEYRAYIFKGELIDLLYKYAPEKVKSDIIRTETNGWEYGRCGSAHKTKALIDVAKGAISANGMDFGGVDIIRNNEGYYALETNSEPGIGKITAQLFANAIRKEAGL